MATPRRVPRQHEAGLAKIRDLSDESAQELLEALRKIPLTYKDSSLSMFTAERVDTVAASDVEEIVKALLSIYVHLDHSQESVPDFVGSIAQTMEMSESERLGLPTEDRPHFEKRLVDLLSIDRLNIVVRAASLSVESEHSLQDARIVSDTRAVFEPEDAEAEPRGAIILHQLKISYWGDNSLKTFFATLDSNGLRRLRQQLDRAESKAENLKAVLKAARTPYIDAE